MNGIGKNKEKVIFFRIKFYPGKVDNSITDIQISNPKGNSNHMSKPFEK